MKYDFLSYLLMLAFSTLGVSYLTGIFFSLFYFTTGEVDKLQKAKKIALFSLLLLLFLGLIIFFTVTMPTLIPTNPPSG